ncbi:M43 family zinc metalloprotease [Pontibacter sp. H249]|uniref:M43 family zinc metalloprotease n=1 Tax=Pontibacter sp. H249 TaxID=3133420 RepID=UPI0030BB39A8
MKKNLNYNLRKFVLLLSLTSIFLFSYNSFAQKQLELNKSNQPFCYTSEVENLLRKQYPELGSQDAFEKALQAKIIEYKETLKTKRIKDEVFILPVVFHIIHNGEPVGTGVNLNAQYIYEELKIVNDFLRQRVESVNPASADIGIELAPALRDPKGVSLSEPGIHRYEYNIYTPGMTLLDVYKSIENELKPTTIWDSNKYLNIWIVDHKDGPLSDRSYANSPITLTETYTISDLTQRDGIVIDYLSSSINNFSETVAHEFGHWLGLRHTWGPSDEEIPDCSGDDFCEDTPAHKGPNFGCPTGIDTCPTPGLDPIDNLMNYSDCSNIFTNDQKVRMHTVLMNLTLRKSLLKSTVHLQDNGKPTAYFEVDRTFACALFTNFRLTDRSTNNPTSWQWSILDRSGNLLSTFTQQHLTVFFNVIGSFGVQLVVRNNIGSDTLYIPNLLIVKSNTFLTLPMREDMETAAIFPNWLSYNKSNDGFSWMLVRQFNAPIRNIIGSDGKPTTALKWGRVEQYTSIVFGERKEDWFLSPLLNLAQYRNAEISFDVAYKPILGSGDPLYDDRVVSAKYSSLDTISLKYTTDCGLTYTTLWKKGGEDLATLKPEIQEQIFIPTAATQWRRESISLAGLNGLSNVSLALVISAGSSGQNIYIDNLEIKVPPVMNVPVSNFNVKNTSVCEGLNIQFSDISTGAPSSWNWSFPGGVPSSSKEQHPFVTYSTPGTYTVTLTTSNALGNNTISKKDFIVVNETGLKAAASLNTVCLGDTIFLIAQGGVPNKPYYWEASNGKSLLGAGYFINPYIIPAESGTYSFRLFGESEAGCIVRSSVEVEVKDIPTKPTITQGAPSGSGIAKLTSSNTSGNQWFKDMQPIVGAKEQVYEVMTFGSYAVQVTSENCSSLISDEVNIGVTALTPTHVLEKSIEIFPNPATQEIVIRTALHTSKNEINYVIYNILGVKLEEGVMNKRAENWEHRVNLTNWNYGQYVVVIWYDQTRVSRSFVKL